MVSGPAPALTKIGFRRDIKYFLAIYVGFLVGIIMILLSLLQVNTADVADSMQDQWNAIADAAASVLSNTPGDIDVTTRLSAIRLDYGISAIEFVPLHGRKFQTGNDPRDSVHITRSIPNGKAIFKFDATRLHLIERRFRYTAGISLAATVIGTLLLIAYLPRVVRPIEQMLDYAREMGEREAGEDEQKYLIETFRRSIDTLKTQEEELKNLHEAEKMRADELQLVTATLTRTLTSGFIAIDRDGCIVDINASGREILGLSDSAVYRGMTVPEALGETPFAHVLADALARLATLARHEVLNVPLLPRAAGEKVPQADEGAPLTRPLDGATLSPQAGRGESVIGLSTVPLVTDAGEHLGMIALFTDLSPVRVLEARVREMQTLAELGEISAGIAHEFRNALSAILGYLKLARRQGVAADVDAKLRNAEQEAVVLSGAVDGLLSFARPMKLERHRVDVGELVEDVVERLSVSASGVSVRIEGEPFTIDGDAAMLSRAVENVIRNAVESAKEKSADGEVVIEMRPDPPAIEIRDNGVGVDPADVPRLFLPFQSQKSSGLGLGLPLARKVVLLHGGSIRLTGAPGTGATVTIDFTQPAGEAPEGRQDWYNLYQPAKQA